jgi:hypothetical protein
MAMMLMIDRSFFTFGESSEVSESFSVEVMTGLTGATGERAKYLLRRKRSFHFAMK